MWAGSCHPLVKSKGDHLVSWNLKEAGGKVSTRETRIVSGIQSGMSLPNKAKSNKLHGYEDVNAAGT